MKNGRRNNDNDSKRDSTRDSKTISNRSNFSDAIGTIDREQSPDARKDFGIRVESSSSDGIDTQSERTNTNVTLPAGYYFTPDGTVTRIPDGYYLKPDGRLAKRRKSGSDASDSADGNEDRNRTETDNESKRDTEIPIRQVKVSRKKKITETQQRLTMVAMLSVALSATFTSIALLTKHRHWALDNEEIPPFAEALNDALATLPTKAYETIIAVIEKWVPWVNLVFVTSAIIIPRIEESIKRVEDTRYKSNNVNDKRNAGTENNNWPNEASFGFNE